MSINMARIHVCIHTMSEVRSLKTRFHPDVLFSSLSLALSYKSNKLSNPATGAYY